MKLITQRFLICLGLVTMLAACSSTPDISATNVEVIRVAEPNEVMQAVMDGKMSELKDLVADGASVNVITPEGSALFLAASKKFNRTTSFLVDYGADPNLVNEGQRSPLMVYAQRGDANMVRLLMAAGADVNYQDGEGESAMSLACYDGHLTTVKALLSAGANVNVTPGGKSLLMHIVENNDLLLAQLIISAGADVNYKDSNGNTALRLAKLKGYRDLEMLLIQSGGKS